MTITKEQLKDIGWALSILRGFQRLGFTGHDDEAPRLASAEAGFKALAMKPTGPYTPVQRAELLIRQLPVTHEGRNLWLKDHGEGLHMPAPYCTDCDGTAEVEHAAPKAHTDANTDSELIAALNVVGAHNSPLQTVHEKDSTPVQPLSFEDDIKSKDW